MRRSEKFVIEFTALCRVLNPQAVQSAHCTVELNLCHSMAREEAFHRRLRFVNFFWRSYNIFLLFSFPFSPDADKQNRSDPVHRHRIGKAKKKKLEIKHHNWIKQKASSRQQFSCRTERLEASSSFSFRRLSLWRRSRDGGKRWRQTPNGDGWTFQVFINGTDCVQSRGIITASGESTKMVKTFQAYLPPTNRTYSCVHCRAHLASHDELISKSFQGSQGRAYLFNSV